MARDLPLDFVTVGVTNKEPSADNFVQWSILDDGDPEPGDTHWLVVPPGEQSGVALRPRRDGIYIASACVCVESGAAFRLSLVKIRPGGERIMIAMDGGAQQGNPWGSATTAVHLREDESIAVTVTARPYSPESRFSLARIR